MRATSRTRLALCAFLAVAVPSTAFAATITVNSNSNVIDDNNGACTLPEAVLNANTDIDNTGGDCAVGSGADVIAVPANTYNLVATLVLSDDVTLQGAGASTTILVGGGTAGLLSVLEIAGTVGVQGVTLRAATSVGAINNHGASLTLADSILADNAGVPAGALTNYKGTTTIVRSLLRDNDGPTSCGVNSAGAISVFDGSVRIENSTLSGNQGRCSGGAGAIHVGAGADEVVLAFSTIAATTCTADCPAIVTAAAEAVIEAKASIFAHTAGESPNCSDPLTSLGHNIDSAATCGLDDATDLATTDPRIGSLKNNGGSPTHALLDAVTTPAPLPKSPAIDKVPLEDCGIDDDGLPETEDVPLEEDQRGEPRPADGDAGACDTGAYEGTFVNTPPHAECMNPSLNTGTSTCDAAANVDGGSSDPNGDALTFAQDPPGPYAPGSTPVTLTVTDADGASDTCEATVTVTDNRPPVISCPTANVKRPKKGALHNFGIPATDNCEIESFAVSADPAPECFIIKKGKKGAPDEEIPEVCTIESDGTGVHVTLFPRKKSHMVWTVEAEDENGNTAERECEAIAK
jgi:hypothetical protein